MRNNLAVLLQKYYTRKGNRVVFSNGMSLNQLAMAMWEKLDFREMDASVLSRVLKGERSFTGHQLNTFCILLNLPFRDRENLYECVTRDMAERFGLDSSIEFSLDDYIELTLIHIQKMREARLNGMPLLTVEWSATLAENIRAKIAKVKDEDTRAYLFDLLIQSLRERSRAACESWSIKNGNSIVKEVSRELIDLGNLLRNNHVLGVAYLNLADMDYFVGNYKKSVGLFERALGLLNTNSEEWLLALRNIGLSNAYIGNKDEFENIRIRLLKEIESAPTELHSMVLEGIARGEAAIGNKIDSYKYFEKAQKKTNLNLAKKGPQSILKSIQVKRTQLEMGSKIDGMFKSGYLKKVGFEAISLAQQFGYQRYADQVKELIVTI